MQRFPPMISKANHGQPPPDKWGLAHADDQPVSWNHHSMYYNDHPPPHFHAYYGEHAATIEIATLRTLEGTLPRRVRALVLEWAADRRDELVEDWRLAQAHQPLNRIDPLE
jgi:hypothetical protein